MSVEPAVVDVYDAAKLRQVMAETRSEIVIHQLTDLRYGLEEDKMADALVRNAHLRDVGTRNLIAAAMSAGAEQLIA